MRISTKRRLVLLSTYTTLLLLSLLLNLQQQVVYAQKKQRSNRRKRGAKKGSSSNNNNNFNVNDNGNDNNAPAPTSPKKNNAKKSGLQSPISAPISDTKNPKKGRDATSPVSAPTFDKKGAKKGSFIASSPAVSPFSSHSKKSGKKGQGQIRSGGCLAMIVVANKDDGTLTILDSRFGEVLIRGIEIPYNTFTMVQPKPIDVATGNGMIYISDYNNDRIVVIDGFTYGMVASITVGSKPTKISIDAAGFYLWIINEGDDSVMVLDLQYNVPIRVIEPCDPLKNLIFEEEHRIYDVLVAPSGDYAHVTYTYGNNGLLVRYNEDGEISEFTEKIGDNATLAVSMLLNSVFVASEVGSSFQNFQSLDLTRNPPRTVGSPFDMVSSPDGKYLYVSSKQTSQIYIYNVDGKIFLSHVVTTSVGNPCKMVHTGDRLFVTHETPYNSVTVYEIRSSNPTPRYIRSTKVGSNPFGIAYFAPNGLSSTGRCVTQPLPTISPFPTPRPSVSDAPSMSAVPSVGQDFFPPGGPGGPVVANVGSPVASFQ